MSVTLGQLVGRVRLMLAGIGNVEDIQTELTSSLTSSATTLSVDDASGFSPGLAEVDFELLRIKSVDAASGTITLASYGRGYKGSTAATHASGSEVSFAPIFPKSVVAEAINGVITELYPDLYVVASTDTTVPADYSPITVSDAVGVISVWLDSYRAPGTWERVDSWDYQPDADNALYLRFAQAGQAARIVYAKRPSLFDLNGSLSQDFETVTGLPERMSDLIALGVATRLAPFLPLASMITSSAEARADGKRPENLSSQARLFYSEFSARVASEKRALLNEHPIRVHKVAR